jgi:hypothetical protein
VLAHFADPVPADVWIPDLATQPPDRLSSVYVFGWRQGWQGGTLGVMNATIVHRQAAPLLTRFPNTIGELYGNVPPMVVNAPSERGIQGGGIFSDRGVLLGIRGHSVLVLETGARFTGTFGQPAWRYRDWIRQVITAPPPDPPSGGETAEQRRLASDTDTSAVSDESLDMTPPPQPPVCDLSTGACAARRWVQAGLTGTQGAVAATCAADSSGGCSFAGKTYRAGQSTTLALGTAGGTGIREVLAWCVSQASDPEKVEFSFTNADAPAGQPGHGWWVVTRDSLRTDLTGGNLADLTSC